MINQQQTIAILSGNAALGSIFSSALDESDFRTAVFSTLPALSTFLRIAPVDLAVLNLDTTWWEIVQIARGLKGTPRVANPLLKTVVLTHATPFADTLEGTGVDALLVKPTTPAQLVESISQMLAGARPRGGRSPRYVPTARPAPVNRTFTPVVERHDNVIPLFGYRANP